MRALVVRTANSQTLVRHPELGRETYFVPHRYQLEGTRPASGAACSCPLHAGVRTSVTRHMSDRAGRWLTDSSTPPRAFSSSSRFSFLRCSSVKLRCVAFPFVARAEVGPEGIVGACKPLISADGVAVVGARCEVRLGRLHSCQSRQEVSGSRCWLGHLPSQMMEPVTSDDAAGKALCLLAGGV